MFSNDTFDLYNLNIYIIFVLTNQNWYIRYIIIFYHETFFAFVTAFL